MEQKREHGFYPVEVMVGNRWRSGRLLIITMPYALGEEATADTEDQLWLLDIFSEKWRGVFRIDAQLREYGYRTEMRFTARDLAERYGEFVPIRCVRDCGIWAPVEPYYQTYSVEIEGQRYCDTLKAKLEEFLDEKHYRGVSPYRGTVESVYRALLDKVISTGVFIETDWLVGVRRGFTCEVWVSCEGKRMVCPALVFRADDPPHWEMFFLTEPMAESNQLDALADALRKTLHEKYVQNGWLAANATCWGNFFLGVRSEPAVGAIDQYVAAHCTVQISPDELDDYLKAKVQYGEAKRLQEVQR